MCSFQPWCGEELDKTCVSCADTSGSALSRAFMNHVSTARQLYSEISRFRNLNLKLKKIKIDSEI